MTRPIAAILGLLIASPAIAQDNSAGEEGVQPPASLDTALLSELYALLWMNGLEYSDLLPKECTVATEPTASDPSAYDDLLDDATQLAEVDLEMAQRVLGAIVCSDGPLDVTSRASEVLKTVSTEPDPTTTSSTEPIVGDDASWDALSFEMKDHHYFVYSFDDTALDPADTALDPAAGCATTF